MEIHQQQMRGFNIKFAKRVSHVVSEAREWHEARLSLLNNDHFIKHLSLNSQHHGLFQTIMN